MKLYYKATRPDGTDFYSGTVDYAGALEFGKRLPRKSRPPTGEFACCTSDVYHAADVPTETLAGGSWPCRLFEVTGRPVAEEDHKYGFQSLRVLREIPAQLALGPQSEEVIALIERAKVFTSDQFRWSAVVWRRIRPTDRDDAWRYARHMAWKGARVSAWGAAWAATGNGGPVVGDALLALVVRDLVDSGTFKALYGPWVSVISRPPTSGAGDERTAAAEGDAV
jgi:hypothetical protein